MKKFNKLFAAGTLVRVHGENEHRRIKEVHSSRNCIKVEGVAGWLQRGHIVSFTNIGNSDARPVMYDVYWAGQYGEIR